MGERVLRAYAVALRQWKEGGDGVLPLRNHADSQGGGAMGEAIAPCEVARLGKLREDGMVSLSGKRMTGGENQSLTLIAKGFDRMLVCRLVGGIQPEDETDYGGEPDCQQHHSKCLGAFA